MIKVLGIAGSLREESFNKYLLKNAVDLCPDDVELEVFDIKDIPIYNQDEEMNPPEIIKIFKEKIKNADAILFATPEYNYSIPGVLKNAIDWASRPYGDNSWDGKPVAIMGASVAMTGTARAQYHLRQVFVYLNMFPLNRPEVMVPSAADKFDYEGNLNDEKSREKITELLKALADWTVKLQNKK
ncbi:NAD(P)H-dependent oxidoreductase [Candidatus Pacearchaeota archaeon]|nr:NAD(P)H-dependent oxidoreductase [Candidatus Pacearchaeota archaeon]